MVALLDVILPVFLVIGFGYLAVRRGYFSDAGVDGLMRFTQKFAIPCLLFRAMSTLDLSANFDLALLASFYVAATICFVLGFLGARWLFDRPWEDCVAIGFCCLFSNSVLLGLPIAERAYGADSLSGNFALIAVHSPFCYMLGISTMEVIRNRGETTATTGLAILKAMFSNALIIGIFLGLSVNLLAIPLPGVFVDGIDLMVQAALPAALFGMGGVLVRYKPEGDARTIAFVVCISLLVHPSLALTMGWSLGLDQDNIRSLGTTAAMAPGINTYVFADMYGRARRVAASSVLFATAASVITVWAWLAVLG